jgi:phosphoribosylaminoimidazole-succinocarboxamide synthase
MDDADFRRQLKSTLQGTHFTKLGTRYAGKVRDTYASGDRLLIVTTDRLSAFDRVLTTLPFKGDMLSSLSHFWFQKTADIVKNHVIDLVDPAVLVARLTRPILVEVVIRGALTGSLWRDYEKGIDAHALKLEPGLLKDMLFEKPILTPSTKAPVGQHDLPLSEHDIVKSGLVDAKRLDEIKDKAFALFEAGQQHARARGLILVDTKYEFGLLNDQLIVIDEMHTPDSSRYWVAAEYQQRFAAGQSQKMLDKENLRQWLLTERQFSGHGDAPEIPDAIRCSLSAQYCEAWEWIVGKPFAGTVGDTHQRIVQNLEQAGFSSERSA